MSVFDKVYYHTWNIGFVESSTKDIVVSDVSEINVHWVKHNYKDRFFADPFILSVDDDVIKVLVEDFPYYDKRGMISLLTVDRKKYKLLEKKVVLKQPFHMSYPFIMRKKNGEFWVAPEASQSGNLYYYSMNPKTQMLENQRLLVPDSLLDSTIMEYDGRWWLFCTKRGRASDQDLFIYYADTPEGPWKSHAKNPVLQDTSSARPAGYFIKDGETLFRISQKNDKFYGEAVNVLRVDKLTPMEFEESFIKILKIKKDDYSNNFHTFNGYENITVVDGIKVEFRPLHRIWYEFINYINRRKG